MVFRGREPSVKIVVTYPCLCRVAGRFSLKRKRVREEEKARYVWTVYGVAINLVNRGR